MNFEKELYASIEAGLLAKKAIMEIYNKGFNVEIKDDNSPVTEADKLADKIIKEYLSKKFPSYAFLTEESSDDKKRLNNDYVFIIDPIDGTKDFVSKDGQFTINIGLSYKHKVVMGVVIVPTRNEYFYATINNGAYYASSTSQIERIHTSRKKEDLLYYRSVFHFNDKEKEFVEKNSNLISKIEPLGSSIKACYIALGKGEITLRMSDGTKEWDTCAFQIIVEEAGGAVLKFDGTPITYNREDVYNRGGYIVLNNKKTLKKLIF